MIGAPTASKLWLRHSLEMSRPIADHALAISDMTLSTLGLGNEVSHMRLMSSHGVRDTYEAATSAARAGGGRCGDETPDARLSR
jgi:hypothetical protein